MHTIRRPAVAGSFYPASRLVLASEIETLLDAVAPAADQAMGQTPPKAIVVPHAGYIYSGQTAARAYARLAAGRKTIKRVVLLGPVHRVPVRGLALPGADAFATPLGEVELDQAAIALLAEMQQVVVSPAVHAQEHSLEVQLPFLQSVLDDFKLVPLAVGDATPAQVAQVLEVLWGGPETAIVVSSDLSHYLPYADARAVDLQTVHSILGMNASLTHRQACGGTPVNGLLLAAGKHQLQPRLLGLCNSGDSTGDRSRVVGYASFIFADQTSHASHA